MAPTTLPGQKTTTSPAGRNTRREGYPIRVCEVFALLGGTAYLERVAVNKPAAIRNAKRAIAKAFQYQMKNLGFSLVEILSPCPTNWKMNAVDACKWIDEIMSKEFPLGVIKDIKC